MSTYLHQHTPTYQYRQTDVTLPSSVYLSLPIPKYPYIIAGYPGAGDSLVLNRFNNNNWIVLAFYLLFSSR